MAINTKFEASIEIETGFYSNLSRMNMKMEEALKEFIDNSTTSFYDHEQELYRACRIDQCVVEIEWNDDEVVISDNAYGMNKSDFERALRLNARADNYSETSRGFFGIGLKYAAANIGRCYEIESNELDSSKKYDSIIDLDELERTNQKTVSVNESNVLRDEHGTIITITQLLVPFSDYNSEKTGKKTNFEKLLDKLGKIYNSDIQKGKLKIIINNTEVKTIAPVFLKDKETKSLWYQDLDECSFRFRGKTYKYDGWIGILNTANVENAGFSLKQQNRAIELNYRPKALFGLGNDYRCQRVVGDINLIGGNWKVSFTKNRFQWANGLEDAFIKSLNDQKNVKDLFKYAKDYRKNNENVTNDQIKKMGLEDTFKKLSKQTNPPKEKKYNPTKVSTSDKPTVVKEASETKYNDEMINITYNDKDYKFKIIPNEEKAMKDKWFQLKEIDSSTNEYQIEINARVKMFEEYNKKDMKELIVKLAISISLAQLDAVNMGLKTKESEILINSLNKITSSI